MKSKILVLCFLIVSVFACRVTLVPAYDAAIEDQITTTAKLNDALYLHMLETPEADRKYDLYSLKYVEVELEINSILLKTQARDHNNDLLKIVQNLQTLFVRHKNDHKVKSLLKNADIKLNQGEIRAIWTALLIAEKALKRQT